VTYVSPSIEEKLNNMITHVARWMQREAPYVEDEQMHLQGDHEALAYYQFGYLNALRALQRTINGS
jgi:hypothetical protein